QPIRTLSFPGQPCKLSDPSPGQPEPTLRGPPQGPLLLEKPDQRPPIFLEGEKGESSAWDVVGQERNAASPGVEPLKASRSDLGSSCSSASSVQGMRQPRLEERSDASLVSSGYAGDEESSEVDLVDSRRLLRLTKRLHAQGGSSESSQLCSRSPPKKFKQSRLGSPAHSTQQTGGEQ
ncbi:protein TNT, partial [Oryctolagus cuniculus]|uniref:protein TNT n=1 Tax=Oryctolagus cuniculus TaxID=9986 RepID=UPI003879704D